jgi:hypothetical protein
MAKEKVEDVLQNITKNFLIIKVGDMFISGASSTRSYALHASFDQARQFDKSSKADMEKYNALLQQITSAEVFEVIYHTIKTRTIEGVDLNETR